MVITGVIVSYIADGMLLTVIASILACAGGLLIAYLRFASATQRFWDSELSAQSALLTEMAVERMQAGELVPVRCSSRPALDSVRSAPLNQFRPPAGAGLRGWQSDGR